MSRRVEQPKRNKLFDAIFLCVVVVLYAILAFFNLGDDIAPQTFYRSSSARSFFVTFPEKTAVTKLLVYTGETENNFEARYRYKMTGEFGSVHEKMFDGPFKWSEITINKEISELEFMTEDMREVSFGEIAALDKYGNRIENMRVVEGWRGEKEADEKIPALTDEPETVPSASNPMNTTYFDEIYFAQTAYEYANGLEGYETVHPPLGKIIQSIPIAISGRMTPLTWRMQGTICGILIIVAVYFLALVLFKRASFARVAAILTAFSGIHFVQTRVGTIDSHLCLFTILSYLFMFKFVDKEDKGYGKIRNFALSGIFFGCSFATKWSGAFGGFGLAILWFKYLLDRGFWHAKELKFKQIVKNIFEKNVRKLVRLGIIFFILVPGVIYCSSYLLFPKTTLAKDLNDVSKQSVYLFRYHSNESTPHPYSSPWWSWPIGLKPMLYAYEPKTHKELYLMENYAIAYVSVIALAISIYFGIRDKHKSSTLIVLAWLSLLLPYALISRPMFLYHYMPASVFAILAIVNMFYLLPGVRKIIPYYLIAVAIAFALSYPKMTGVI